MRLELGPYTLSIGRERRNIENPSHGITSNDVYGAIRTRGMSGETAMRSSAVLASVRVLAESIASLSWLVYKRAADGGKMRATDHPLFYPLHTRPNPLMSSFTYRERVMKDLLLQGNSYSMIEWGRADQGVELWPLNPLNVLPMVALSGRDMHYRVRTSSGEIGEYNTQQILHFRCLGDGLVGKSVISYNGEAVGLAQAEDEFAQSFFDNGAYAGGVLETEKALSKDARDRLRDGWGNAYGRQSAGWHKVAVLEDGMKWKAMTINPKDAMALESRQYQVTEIARMFRVPPHMIADLSKATFSNIEHQSLDFVVHTLRPWLIRIEQEVNHKLFGHSMEQESVFSEFLLDSLLRGDTKSRNEAYAIMRQNGVINADEWRERENMNPLPDGQGEKYLVQLNMQELSQIGAEPVEPDEDDEPEDELVDAEDEGEDEDEDDADESGESDEASEEADDE